MEDEELPISGGPHVFLKGNDTFFIAKDARDELSDEISNWVFDNINPSMLIYEHETSEYSPFESYTFLRIEDVVKFKLFWFGR